MAIGAGGRRRLIEQNQLALHLALQRVTQSASHVGMPTLQGKLRALIVIERRRRPSLNDMTVPAFGDPVLRDELAAMRIGMAGFAILRCSFELNIMSALNRLVTIAAPHRAVSAHEGKLRLGMIEVPNVDPRSRIVACLTA